jgi:ketosteroid isomerase-like protein
MPVGQTEPEEAGNTLYELSPVIISATQDEMPLPEVHSKRNTSGGVIIAAIVIIAACGFLAWNTYRHWEISFRIPESKHQVQEAVSIWADAYRSRNSTAVAASYATTVEKYFRKNNVSRDQIHGYFQSAFNRIGYINTYQIDNIKIDMLPALNARDDSAIQSRAAATFHKTWDTRQFDGKTSSGEVIERLTFTSTAEGWKIVREEELSVIRASRQ